ncbi:O-methyltransferase [Peptoniphilus sp. KCTC 25270]|uniref:O-methyltransferase n=1 Tax=Peptoniphilus sp. KCTC 25270 TaxID=2897414 RepID=UPI001E537E64|nr:O-methyltransferase [Peptoniphilus sp. KCTC 25270]MCD1147170.1 O-methyltransferase [Peptoniphilus sp. KCTC 25270]
MSNVVEKYIEEYLEEILPSQDEYLEKMRAIAEEDAVPIVEREIAEFLQFFLGTIRPQKILELGTAIGYSASLMAKTLPEAKIDTVEIMPEMAIMARTHFHNQGIEDQVQLHVMDAMDFVKETKETYDFIFVDAAKGQYEEYFQYGMEHLSKDGVMLLDNVLFHGMIANEELFVRRKVTIVKRMRKFLPEVLKDKRYKASLLPVADGILLVRRNHEKN